MERIFIIWNIQVIISLGKRLSENNGQKRISKEDTDMSMNVSSNYNPASVGGQYFRNGNDKKQLDAIKQSGK